MHYIRRIKVVIILAFMGIFAIAGCQQEKNKEEKGLTDRLLLKDWMPESKYKVPKHEIKKARYPAIDVHSHSYTDTKEEVKERLNIMDKAGVEKAIVLTGATGAKFDSLYSLYSQYPKRFDVYCGIDYTGYKKEGWSSKAVKELKRLVEAGCEGIGELGDKGKGLVYSQPTKAIGMHPDDPRMDPVFEAAGEMGLPVNLHVTDPIWMYEPMDSTNDGLIRSYTWRIKNQNGKLGHNELIKSLENTVRKHPNTTFVAAHVANLTYDLTRVGNLLDKYGNLYVDIGARFAELSTIPRSTADFIESHQNRVLYGTDYGWETFDNDTEYGNNTTTLEMYRTTFRILETRDDHFYLTDLMGYKWPMYGINISDTVLRKVYRENMLKIARDK